MKKIALMKDNKVISVNEFAAKLLKKSGWIETSNVPEVIKEKGTSIQVPSEIKELIISKKEDVVAKAEPIDVISEKKTATIPAKKTNLKPAVKKIKV
jgi:hypothetical protein